MARNRNYGTNRSGEVGLLGKLVSCIASLALVMALLPSMAYAAEFVEDESAADDAAQEAVSEEAAASAAEEETAAEEEAAAEDGTGSSKLFTLSDEEDDFLSYGSGTESDPYLIMSDDDYATFAEGINADTDGTYRSACYKLYADVSTSTVVAPSSTYAFTGTFNGNDHTVALSISGTGYQGMFGYLNGATVNNLTVSGTVEATTSYAAGIAAYALNSVISEVTNNATVTETGSTYAGGVVGYASGTNISDSANTGAVTVSTNQYAGGIAAYQRGGEVRNCTNSGAVTAARSYCGGIVGYALCSTAYPDLVIEGCSNSGTVASTASSGSYFGVGGVVGYASGAAAAYGELDDCTNTGTVSGLYSVGGVVGYANYYNVSCLTNEGDVTSSSSNSSHASAGGVICTFVNGGAVERCRNAGTVTATAGYATVTAIRGAAGGVIGAIYNASTTVEACYNTGSVTGASYQMGGIVGMEYGSSTTVAISDCYNRGAVTYTGSTTSGTFGIAGILGVPHGSNKSVVNCYSTGTVSSSSTSPSVYAGAIVGYTAVSTTVTNCYSEEDSNAGSSSESGTAGGKDGTVKTATELKASGFAATLGGNYADDTDSTYNAGYPYLRWQNPDSTYAAEIDVTLAKSDNDSSENAIELTVLDANGADVTSSFTAQSTNTSSAATWTFEGAASGSTYTYTVTKKGYETATGTISIEALSVSESVTLVAETYSYTLTVSPAGADVTVKNGSSTLSAASTSTDSEAGTKTYTYTGLYNSASLTYEIECYGYVTQTGTGASISFADASDTVTLESDSTYSVSLAISVPSGCESAPDVLVYNGNTSSSYYGDLLYDSSESATAAEADEQGVYSFTATGLTDGTYLYATYAPGCFSLQGTVTIEGADTAVSATLSAASTTWDGSSTEVGWYLFNEGADTYYLYTAADLAGFSALVGGSAKDNFGSTVASVNFSGATVCLAADIDLDGEYWTPIGGWTNAISSALVSSQFAGTFDGCGYSISNLLVGKDDDGDQVRLHGQSTASGLFSKVTGTSSSYAELKNLTLVNPIIGEDAGSSTGQTEGAGALVGCALYANIDDVTVDGGAVSISSQMCAGGIVGRTYYSTISGCTNSATVTSTTYYDVGGIAGYFGCGTGGQDIRLVNCSNSGTITGSYDVGGIIGYGYKGALTVEECFNTGSVNATVTTSSAMSHAASSTTAYGLGGIVGRYLGNSSGTDKLTISLCYNTGDITGSCSDVGGLLGGTNGYIYYSYILNSYNTGDVTSTSTGSYPRAGGLAGSVSMKASPTSKQIQNCYSSGVVSIPNSSTGYLGGLVGGTQGTVAGITSSNANSNYFANDLEGGAEYAIGYNYGGSESSDIDGVMLGVSNEAMLDADFPAYVGDSFAADYSGSYSLNEGYPILSWQLVTDFAYAEIDEIYNQLYTGSAIEPAVNVSLMGVTLVEGTDYELAITNNTALGTATVTATALESGSYTGSVSTTFNIVQYSISEAAIAAVASQTYTGSAIEPALSVTLGEAALTAGTEYKVVYSNNTDVGTATATIVGIGDYAGTVSTTFTIEAADISKATIAALANQPYTGEAVEPALDVTYNDIALVAGVDYTVVYSNNVNTGTATATLTGTGNFTGTATTTFGIGTDLSGAAIAVENQTYTGSALEPALTVTLGEGDDAVTLTAGTDYTAAYEDNTDVGTATVTITGIGGYASTASTTFAIEQADLANVTIAALDAQTYTGSAITPALTVSLGGYSLVADTDYTLVYSDNTDVGTATVTLTGTGNFTGTATATFAINQASLADVTASLEETTLLYTGEALEPEPTAALGDYSLVKDTDYTLSYSDNTNVGTATVTLTGTGNFTGTASLSFAICYDITACTLTLGTTEYVYDSTAKEPETTVVYSVTTTDEETGETTVTSTTTLAAGTDYTVAYADNTDAGTATATVTGIGSYSGTLSAEYTINQASIGDATATYATTTYTYSGTAFEPEPTAVTYGSYTLVAGTDYTISYADNTDAGTATVTLTGTGNFTGTLDSTFTIEPLDFSSLASIAAIGNQGYTGEAVEPDLTITIGEGDDAVTLVAGTDYTVAYSNNVSAGTDTATATATGTGNYTGSVSANFSIGTDITEGTLALITAAYTYDGTAKQPGAIVLVDGEQLTEDEDYAVTYTDNVNAGTATVTVTGINYYAGTLTTTFTIAMASLASAEIALDTSSYTYDGSSKTPTPTATLDGVTLTNGTDYTVTYLNNVNAGTATLTIEGMDNYYGTASQTFTIAKATVDEPTAATGLVYTGSEQTGVSAGDKYTVYGGSAADAGSYTASAVLNDTANYMWASSESSEALSVEWSIAKATVTEPTAATGLVYTGSEQTGVSAGDYYTVTGGSATDAGTYTATASLTDTSNYAWATSGSSDDLSIEWSIATNSIDSATLKLGTSSYTYDGNACTPSVTVTLSDGTELVEGTDYEVAYSDNTNAGTATVTATGTGSCTGSLSTTFAIAKATVTEPTAATGLTYTGSELTGVSAGDCYTVTGGTATDAGSYTATASLADADNYAWSSGSSDDLSIEYTISAANINNCTLTAIDDQVYTGSEIIPSVVLSYNDVALEQGVDFTVSASNNTEVGTATALITGTGNYSGFMMAAFTIVQSSTEVAEVTLSETAHVYDGTAFEPAVTVTLDGTELAEGTDYTLTYSNNVNVGTATATIEGCGNYTGTSSASFQIVAASITSEHVTLSSTSYSYNGKAKTPGVTVKANGTVLVKGTDYTVAYAAGRTAIGTYEVTIEGCGNYTGTVTKTFTIKLGKVKLKSVKAGKKGSKKLTVKWAKYAGGVSYQIAYKKAKGGKWKYVKVSSKKVKKVLTKLKKGKKYKVKVRACLKVSGKTYYGTWSSTKTKKVK